MSTVASPLPIHIEHDRTARRILEVAATLFGQRGVHGTTVRDIAEGAGIRAPSIYEHFESKERIVGELMRIGRDTTLAEFDRALAGAPSGPVPRLEAAVASLVRIHTAHPMLLRFLTDDVHGLPPEITEPAVSLRIEMSLRLGQILVDGESSGVFSFPNLVTTVAAVHGLFIRIPHWFVAGDDFGVDELIADYRQLVLAMVRPPERVAG